MTARRKSSRRKNQPGAFLNEEVAARRLTVFHKEFREDLLHWVQTDRKIAARAFALVEAIVRDPFQGIGKPEPLSHSFPNTWSRRLTDVDRIVYVVGDDRMDFLQARYHY